MLEPLVKVRHEPLGYNFLNQTEIVKVAVVSVPLKSKELVTLAYAPALPVGTYKAAAPSFFSVMEKAAPFDKVALWVDPVVPELTAVLPFPSSNDQCPIKPFAKSTKPEAETIPPHAKARPMRNVFDNGFT